MFGREFDSPQLHPLIATARKRLFTGCFSCNNSVFMVMKPEQQTIQRQCWQNTVVFKNTIVRLNFFRVCLKAGRASYPQRRCVFLWGYN